jgi:hypothetical protein
MRVNPHLPFSLNNEIAEKITIPNQKSGGFV